MFDAIANPKGTGRTGGSIAASVVLHGMLAGAALLIVHSRQHAPPAVEVPLPSFRPGPPPSATSGNAVKKAHPERARSRPSSSRPVEPREIPRTEAPPPLAGEAHREGAPGAVDLA